MYGLTPQSLIEGQMAGVPQTHSGNMGLAPTLLKTLYSQPYTHNPILTTLYA